MIRVFIQARMSSKRFPGKVLAPFRGRPVIECIVSRVAEVIPIEHITVATSEEQSDDPLASYLQRLGVSFYRGPLDDVFGRFQLCLRENPCTWFFRVCADSPLLDNRLMQTMLPYAASRETDVVTNVQVRSFPKGSSLEMINAATFTRIDGDSLDAAQREHVTKIFYDRPAEFRIVNIQSHDSELAKLNWAVDTVEDLHRLESTLSDPQLPRPSRPYAPA
jgi:spore coat polysaccharide biosynthesis protein SpsF